MKTVSIPHSSQTSSGKIHKGVLFGCGGCLVVILLGILGFFGIFYTAMSAIKGSDAYKMAMAEALKSPAVIDACGEPIAGSFWTMGSFNLNNGEGQADFVIPLTGPKGGGALTVSAHHGSGQQWQFDKLDFTGPAGTTSLLTGGDAPAPEVIPGPEAPKP